EHACPSALAAVDADVVHVTSDARLEHHLGELAAKYVMVGRPPGADLRGECVEGALLRDVDDDGRPYRGVGRRHAHVSSLVARSTVSLKPANASVQSRSKYERTAATPSRLIA